MSLADARIAGQVMPGAKVARAWPAAFVWNVGWRAPILPLVKGGEREDSKRLKREEQSTVAGRAGGPVRSSGEVPAWCGGGGAKGLAYPWFVCLINQ